MRSEVLRVRVSPEERERFALAAEGEGRSVSDWSRRVLLRAVDPTVVAARDSGVEMERKLRGDENSAVRDRMSGVAGPVSRLLGEDAEVPMAISLNEVKARLVVDEETGCWNWPGATNGSGYGHIGRGGHWFTVHRLVYADERGQIPDGHVLHHSCENLVCANPGHLIPMTPEDHRVHHMSEFTDEDVAALIDEGLSRREISAYGISPKRIARVRATFSEGEPRADDRAYNSSAAARAARPDAVALAVSSPSPSAAEASNASEESSQYPSSPMRAGGHGGAHSRSESGTGHGLVGGARCPMVVPKGVRCKSCGKVHS